MPAATVIVGSSFGGSSFGGSSFVSALSDFVVQVRGTCLAITSPAVIKAATGERIGQEELGGAEVHLTRTGQIDLAAETPEEAFGLVRRFLGYLPSNAWSRAPRGTRAEVADDPGLPGLVPASRRRAYDMRKVLRRILDDEDWLELRPGVGRSLLTGLGRIDGHAVGVVASQPLYHGGVLTPDACDKAIRLICLCDAFDVPIVFLQDCPGFLVGSAVERSRMLYKAVMLLQAMSLARTPRLTVVVRKGFGLAYFTLGGNDMGSDLVCCWPSAEISLMDPEVSAGVVPGDMAQADVSPFGAAGIMKVDEVIHPAETRPVLARALDRLDGACATPNPAGPWCRGRIAGEPMTASEARDLLVAYGRRLVQDGLTVGTSGNLSVRLDDAVAITPSGVPYDQVEPADIALVTLDGTPIEGGRPSSELRLHLGIYASTRAGAVVHTHSPYATALSTVLAELPPIHYTMAILGGAVPVVPYVTYGTQELADTTRAALEGRRAALLQSHGVVTYGRTLAAAYERAQLVEWVSQVYIHASSIGEPRIVTAEELEDVARRTREGRA